ncbi:hypothetical protein MKW94_000859 [Papaver nudicaule]|uniref:EF-hand domain-containing protein n=1 Tax=Papaver nudicaule TaxID=74823 RepID=A0AA41V4U8_PAPNU|nr:hypothetical protein [Papaver nudicaule]
MAIQNVFNKKSVPPSKNNMSLEQFREWLRSKDTNGDGQISRQELEKALRELGIYFPGWRARRAMAYADINNNGHLDGDIEVTELLEYVKKRWGTSCLR